jgi:G3E family GTPase
MENKKIPVTILTGFLGSGKTTLLNRILTENHGKKIAVIENEFGEIGVDNELVIGADEEIFEMNNGCICCTVRGDLIRILTQLTKRKDKLDMIIVETTGMANPAPVAQTFWVDTDMREQFSLDAIITIVDTKHVWQHIDSSDECKEQIAFADIILLNKIDLVSESELAVLETRIKNMNSLCTIYKTENASIDLQKLLNIHAFDLEKKAEFSPNFLQEELPFEAVVKYSLENKKYQLVLEEGPDPSFDLYISDKNTSFDDQKSRVTVAFSEDPILKSHQTLLDLNVLNQLQLTESENEFWIEAASGDYTFFTQHGPDEFNMQLKLDGSVIEPIETIEFEHSHTHDDEVSSVGIDEERALDPQKFQRWISWLLQERGTDIFRSKGVLYLKGFKERIVFQGVHMLFGTLPDRVWGTNERKRNQLIFIGKNLDRNEIIDGFESCLVK